MRIRNKWMAVKMWFKYGPLGLSLKRRAQSHRTFAEIAESEERLRMLAVVKSAKIIAKSGYVLSTSRKVVVSIGGLSIDEQAGLLQIAEALAKCRK